MRDKKKKFLAADPAMKGKEVYVVYCYDIIEEALESEETKDAVETIFKYSGPEYSP